MTPTALAENDLLLATYPLWRRKVRNRRSASRVIEEARQMWDCLACRGIRQWGFGKPWDQLETPVLNCKGCGEATRHGYVGVI